MPNNKDSYIKKADIHSKVGKYFMNRRKGMTKADAQIMAGYSPKSVTRGQSIENTKTYKALELRFRDLLLKKLDKPELADELIKNIRQDKDRGAKNTAIKMMADVLGDVFPKETVEVESQELVVVFKKDDGIPKTGTKLVKRKTFIGNKA